MLKTFLCSIKQLYTLNSLCRPVPADMCIPSTIFKLLEDALTCEQSLWVAGQP